MTRPCHHWTGRIVAKLKRIPERGAVLPDRVKPMPKVPLPFYHSPEWRALVREVKAERGNWCEQCGGTQRIIGDHIEEIKDGGAQLDKGNVRLLCTPCHQRKTARERARRAGAA